MTARIHLDRPHAYFTNLDIITGKVIVQLVTDTSISAIQVKLEGESRTRLAGPRYQGDVRPDKKKTELEVHKLLYKVSTVFPSPEVYQHGSSAVYTLPAGVHEYPFKFKFPFNNSCSTHNSMLTNLNMTGLRLEVARDTDRHVKKTLPPSLRGFPGEAEIKYYVKATIVRPQFYKENIRSISEFNFLPIEPPKMGDPKEETYARRQHQFTRPGAPSQRKGLFQKISGATGLSSADGPRFSVDARLPNPPILTINEPIPLRVLVTKISDTLETIYLQMIQIELIAYTHIRAHDLARKESGSWVLVSHSNMNQPLIRGEDATGQEFKIDPAIWSRIPLPSSVAPSFETCNIWRTYELEVRVGLSHGIKGAPKLTMAVLPLRIPVKVYSGVAPPQALLDAMAGRNGKAAESAGTPTSPSQRPPMPPRPSAPPVPAYPEDGYADAPPSYEDAIAEDLGPVDGPRRDYNPPDGISGRRTVSETGVGSPDEKGRERLFPDSVGTIHSNASVESFDMLPSTPTDSHSSPENVSPALSPVDVRPYSAEQRHDEPLPEYQPMPTQLSPLSATDNAAQRRPSNTNLRMNLGVPHRKPVPGHSNGKQPPTPGT
ncbi:hypothetical protein DTO166G4_9069 [Paecilomyces variotii]|nr:hypothetical protein DTO166G4_9069 [Paecilomyces variotii]KAJ9242583.1 hypothetical protein DTO166G5_338 [Paecilomyces variotii]